MTGGSWLGVKDLKVGRRKGSNSLLCTLPSFVREGQKKIGEGNGSRAQGLFHFHEYVLFV